MLSFVLKLGREEWAGWVLTIPVLHCPCPLPSLSTDLTSRARSVQGLLSQLLHTLQAHLPTLGPGQAPHSALRSSSGSGQHLPLP